MARWRRAVELAMTGEEIERLTALSRSRTEAASRVGRAQMLLAYRQQPSFFAVGQRLGVHHQTVQRCVERALAYGALAALDDRPRPGKEPTITLEAKAWLVSLACDKAKEHANLKALVARGIDGYVAPGRAQHPTAANGKVGGPLTQLMRKKIDDGGFETPYRLRKQVVEPVFGQIKQARGFRQFLLRGVKKVRAEWAMICTTHNLLKLFTHAKAA